MFIALVVGYLLFSLSWLLFSLVFIIPKLRHRNFPGPHYRSFLFGNAADFIAHPGEAHLVLQRYRARFGKTFQFYALQRRIVAVTDPDDVKFVLATKALPKAEAFNASVGAFSRDGLLTVPEERHMKQRRAISGRFNDDFLRSLHVQTSAALEEFAGILGDAAESGAVIDFDEMVTRLALDVILRCAFGARIGQIQSADARSKHPLPAAIAKGLNECFKNLGMYPYRMYLTSQKPLKKAMKFISGFCQEIIDERRANPKSDDGVDDLLDIFMNIPGATDDYIIGEVSTFLIAGHDTTSHSLAFLFYELCKHPEIKQKMLEEIDLKMTDPKQTIPAFEDIAEVPYIRAVWKETLRLHPVAATGTMRTATENIILPSSKVRFILHPPSLHDLAHPLSFLLPACNRERMRRASAPLCHSPP